MLRLGVVNTVKSFGHNAQHCSFGPSQFFFFLFYKNTFTVKVHNSNISLQLLFILSFRIYQNIVSLGKNKKSAHRLVTFSQFHFAGESGCY